MSSGNYFSRRWHGQVPLVVLLWRDMLGVGTVINLLATLLAATVLIQGAHGGFALAIHLAPMPYNLFLVGALLRAPDRNVIAAAIAAGWFMVMTLV